MSNKNVVWQNEDGVVAIFTPTAEALAKYSIEEIAPIVAASGKKYGIVDASEIPTDKTFRDEWEVDETLLTDGVGYTDQEGKEVLAELNAQYTINSLVDQIANHANSTKEQIATSTSIAADITKTSDEIITELSAILATLEG